MGLTFGGKRSYKIAVAVFAAFLYAVVFSGVHEGRAYAAADTCTWTGAGSDSNITTAGNWTGCDNGHSLESGDTAIFPAGPTNKNVAIDAGVLFDSVTFSGSGYDISATTYSELSISNNLTISGNNTAFNLPIRFFSNGASTLTHSGSGTNFNDTVIVQPVSAGHDLALDIQTDVSVPNIAQAGPDALRNVTKTGAGTLSIVGEATPTAGFQALSGLLINQGKWKCEDDNCLGDASNDIIICDATLELAVSTLEAHNIQTCTDQTANSVLQISAASVTLSGNISVHESLATILGVTTNTEFSGDVVIDDNELLSVQGAAGYATNTASLSGAISGDGGLIVDNAHVTLTGTNTYTGTTELYNTGGGAVLTVNSSDALGASSGGTTVSAGTTLEFANSTDQFFLEPITVAGSGVGGSYPGALVKTNQYIALQGGVTLTGSATMHNKTSELFVIASVISGNHNLTLTGVEDTGGFALNPNGNNTMGDVIANGIQLLLGGAGDTVIPHNLTLNAVSGKLTRIWLNDDNMIADDSVVTLNNDGSEVASLLNMAVVERLGTIAGNGTIFMSDPLSYFALGGGNKEGTFSGVVQGYTSSQFEIQGGVWTFSGKNTDVGNGFSSYYVNGGKFIANATDASLGLSPFSMSNGILGGTGVIGPVNVYSGTVAPGNSPGCLNVNGNIAFTDAFSHYRIDIQDTTPCSGYDRLSATGTVFLNGATLDGINLGFNSQKGDQYTIISAAAINGTFVGLADGASITAGNHIFRINYSLTAVTLTDITPPSASASASNNPTALANTGLSLQVSVFVGLALAASGGATLAPFRSLSRRRVLYRQDS